MTFIDALLTSYSNFRDSDNVTLLHWAAINNRRELVQYFVKRGNTHIKVTGCLYPKISY